MIGGKHDIVEDAENKLKDVKKIIKNNTELFEECRKYHDIWENSKKGRTAHLHICDIFVGVNFWVHLAENDSMEDFNFFLDKIPYEIQRIDEHPPGRWIRYLLDTQSGSLHVYCEYEKSKHCKVIETGKYEPILKRVCV